MTGRIRDPPYKLMRVLLLYNADAGDDSKDADDIVALIEDAGHKVRRKSKKKPDLDKLLKKPTDLVVVAGGDGTVSGIARRMIGRDTPLTILPLGTANNLAHSLGIDADLKALIAGWEKGSIQPFDAALATHPKGNSVFFESAGLGLFTEVMCQASSHDEDDEGKFTAEERFDRDFRFLRQVAGDFEAQPCTIEVDGVSLGAQVLLCEIMNTRQVGSRLVLAPNASVSDGLLDLVVVTKDDRGLLEHFLNREPSDDHPPHLPILRGKSFRITSGVERIHIGDKLRNFARPKKPKVLEVAIEPGAVRVLVPAVGR